MHDTFAAVQLNGLGEDEERQRLQIKRPPQLLTCATTAN